MFKIATGRIVGVFFGPHKASGVWLATKPTRRMLVRRHPWRCYVALWRLRLRLDPTRLYGIADGPIDEASR